MPARKLYACRADDDCEAKFLTPQARAGHESTHEDTFAEASRDD